MLYIKRMISIYFVIGIFFVSTIYAASRPQPPGCDNGVRPLQYTLCCSGSQQACCLIQYDSKGLPLAYDISPCATQFKPDGPNIGDTILPPVIDFPSTCVEGRVRYDAEGCDTIERTCCSDGSWSDPGEPCPVNCKSDECWNGSVCQAKGQTERACSSLDSNATGTSTRTATCKEGSGWEYTRWSKCECKNGLSWNLWFERCDGGFEVIDPGGGTCNKTCPAGEHLVQSSCCCEFNTCNPGVTPCKCYNLDPVIKQQ